MLKQFCWSPKLAYATGLIASDGNLSKDGRHIAFVSSDLEQIENFKTCLGLSNKVGISKKTGSPGRKICYRLQFSNILFYHWLLEIGLFPAKSYTIGSLQIPDKFFRDFLRGHLDGDGSVVSYIDKYNTFKHPDYRYVRLVVRFISASHVHITWIRNTLQRLLKIKGDLFELKDSRNESRVSIWQLKFMKKESIKLLRWLYYASDIPSLSRKRLKAEEVLNVIGKTKRKVYKRLASSHQSTFSTS